MSVASEIGFLQKASTVETQWLNREGMRFKCNEPIAKRIIDKELGQIKYKLHTKKGFALSDIKIRWTKQRVELKVKAIA